MRVDEINCMRAAAGVTLIDNNKNYKKQESFVMKEKAVCTNCGVVDWVQRNTFRWYGH